MNSNINILNHNIPLYGLFCSIGLSIAILIAILLAKKQGLEFYDFVLISLITLIGAFVGAKLLFLIISWNDVVELFNQCPPMDAIISLTKGGYVFYGGLIGGIISLLITLKIKKQNFNEFAPIFATALSIGHSFGRVGCFFAGCCYGMPYDGLLSIQYSYSINPSTPIGINLLPIQLIEAFLLFFLFLILLTLFMKSKNKNIIPIFYSIYYSIVRFILEFFRGDSERGMLFNLSTSQWISLAIFFITIIIGIIHFAKRKNTP